MVNGVYTKRPVIFKGNINRDFHNVNYEDQSNVEYYDDDDETRQIVPNGDIVWYYPTPWCVTVLFHLKSNVGDHLSVRGKGV